MATPQTGGASIYGRGALNELAFLRAFPRVPGERDPRQCE